MRRLLPGQYGGGSAYCAPGGGAQYGYAMRPISPCGLNTGSGARLFRSTSSIRRALNLPILTTQVLKSLQLHI